MTSKRPDRSDERFPPETVAASRSRGISTRAVRHTTTLGRQAGATFVCKGSHASRLCRARDTCRRSCLNYGNLLRVVTNFVENCFPRPAGSRPAIANLLHQSHKTVGVEFESARRWRKKKRPNKESAQERSNENGKYFPCPFLNRPHREGSCNLAAIAAVAQRPAW